MRDVLTGTEESAQWSPRARQKMKELREQYAFLTSNDDTWNKYNGLSTVDIRRRQTQ